MGNFFHQNVLPLGLIEIVLRKEIKYRPGLFSILSSSKSSFLLQDTASESESTTGLKCE